MEIKCDVIYKKIVNNLSFDILPEEKFIKLIQDGRIGSRFMEQLIPCYFPNLINSENGNSPYDMKRDKILYDEKTLTKNGISFTPSNQKGQGREFNEKDFIKRNNELNYFIAVDVRNFPTIEIVFIESNKIDTKKEKYTVSEARGIFFSGKEIITLGD